MAQPHDFDGYHKWLSITSRRRPPSHYDVLGVNLNEDDHEVIQSAAEQRRRYVESKHGIGRDDQVAEILVRIDEAEITLLNVDLRREYDQQLQLFEKRRKSRQVDPNVSRTGFESKPGRVAGEDNGIVKTYAGIVAILCIAFAGMVLFAFNFLSRTKPNQPVANVLATDPPIPHAQIAVQQPDGDSRQARIIPPSPDMVRFPQQRPNLVDVITNDAVSASADQKKQPYLVEVTELNNGTDFPAPWVTGDGLTIYWENPRGTIWTAQRGSPDVPFERHQQILSGLHPTATDDGLEIIFLDLTNKKRSGRTLHRATRSSATQSFEPSIEIGELLTPGLTPKNPALSNDGLTLYFNLTDERKKEISSTLQSASRKTRTAPWTKPESVQIQGQVKSGNLAWISVSPDGLLLFCCHEGGNSDRQVTSNLMLSRRANLNQLFPQPKAIQVDDLPPLIGRSPRYIPATKELFFARGVGDKKFGIWVVKGFDAADQ